MKQKFNELLEFLGQNLTAKGFTITASINDNPDKLPVVNGFKPDLAATFRDMKTVYGKVELPEDNFTPEQWSRLKALSGTPALLYVVSPQEDKMQLVLSLINAKLSDRQNIIKVYK